MPYRFRLPVHYGSIDYARIAYYPQVLHFCHVAMEEMFPHVVGLTYAQALGEEKVGYPTVRTEADYLRPVPYGEALDMSVSFERIGKRSVTMIYEGRRASDGEVAFRVRNVQVAVDMDAWESRPIPDHHRAGFETILEEPEA